MLRAECATLNAWFQRTFAEHSAFRTFSAVFASNRNNFGTDQDFRTLLEQAYACEVVKGTFDNEDALRAGIVAILHKELRFQPITAASKEVQGAGLPVYGYRHSLAVVNGTYAVLELMAPFQEFPPVRPSSERRTE